VARVAVRLESNEVGAQNTLENLLAAGQTAEKLATGEWRMQEERDIHVRYSLSKHAGQQHQEVVVDDDNVTRLVNLDDLVGELLVHAVVVGPLDSLASAVGGLMLLVMKKCVKIVLGISSPAGLVLEEDALGGSLGLIGEPDWIGTDSLVVRQTVLEAILVLAGNPETINWWWSR
jgi:hypothetical protein